MSWQAIVCGFVVLGVIAIIVFWAMWSKASDAIKHDDGDKIEEKKLQMANIKLNLSVNKNLIEQWSIKHDLQNANSDKQMIKLTEEIGELAQGIIKDNPEQIKDSIGDIFVVMTIICQQLGISFEECVKDAYYVIKDREGTFIKDEDIRWVLEEE